MTVWRWTSRCELSACRLFPYSVSELFFSHERIQASRLWSHFISPQLWWRLEWSMTHRGDKLYVFTVFSVGKVRNLTWKSNTSAVVLSCFMARVLSQLYQWTHCRGVCVNTVIILIKTSLVTPDQNTVNFGVMSLRALGSDLRAKWSADSDRPLPFEANSWASARLAAF